MVTRLTADAKSLANQVYYLLRHKKNRDLDSEKLVFQDSDR